VVFREKSKAFVDGAFRRAARYLADTGHNAARWWKTPFDEPGCAHLLLTIHANSDAALNTCTARLRGLLGADNLRGWDEQDRIDGCHLTPREQGRTAHFGFRDGIANPRIREFYNEKKGHKLHEPGEFLLGYWNDCGFNPWLLVNPWSRPNPWLLPLNPKPKLREFFRNGSFGVFRVIEQDEQALREFATHWAHHERVDEAYVKAKLAGRWPNGRVVRPGELAAPKRGGGAAGAAPVKDLDKFDFSDDQRGEGCPFGAHIRRMNPRGDHVVPTRRHPLIRRGMPYGPKYDDAPEAERGLLGLFFCASLEDQFEFLLREWGNAMPMGSPHAGTARDPFSVGCQDPRAVFDVPMPGERVRQFKGLPSFLTTRGTLYAFFPGLQAIRRIARLDKP
jgi:deferrochelatase/peroxidase EfeB